MAPSLQQVEELFHRLVSLAPDDREKAFEEVTDPELRRQVMDLLRADGEAQGFLDPAVSRDGPASHGETIPGRIGPYVVDGVLGQGGMGVVYSAHDARLERRVAIKTLSRRVSKDPSAMARLRREAKALASLNHPNIASIHGIEEDGDRFYLVLEWVEGVSLAQRLAEGPLPWRETITLLAQLAEALEAAHERGLAHRDVKPSNMILTPDRRLKLLDFGLAKPVRPWTTSSSEPLTAADALVGTCSYMSPEQLKGDKVDAAGDIWAFGCVAFECLSGRRAFPGRAPVEIMGRILDQVPDASLLPSNVPHTLLRLIERCLRKDPKQRLRHIGDARLELVQLAAEKGDASQSSWAAQRARLRAWRSPWLSWLTLLMLGAALGIGFTRFYDGPRSSVKRSRDTIRFDVDVSALKVFNHGSLAISPDGSRIAFAGDGLWTRSLDRLEIEHLADLPGAKTPFFSPDGSAIGFYSARQLMRIHADGGLPVPLGVRTPLVVGATWTEADQVIYTRRWTDALMIRAPDGVERPLTSLDEMRGEISHRWPHGLPGGDAVVFVSKTRTLTTFDEADLAVARVDDGRHRILPETGTGPSYLSTGHLLFCRHGSLVGVPFDLDALSVDGDPKVLVEGVHQDMITGACWYAVSRSGSLVYLPALPQDKARISLWDEDGEGRVLLSNQGLGGAFFGAPRLAPNGRGLLVPVVRASPEIWHYDFDRGTVRSVTEGLGNTSSPVWAPDSEHLAFVQETPEGPSIVTMAVDGSGESRRRLLDPGLRFVYSWSPDGRYLVYHRTPAAGRSQIWCLDLTAARDDPTRVRRLVDSRTALTSPSLSADGSWLTFVQRHRGKAEVFVRPFLEPAPQIQISVGGAGSPIWSQDGLELLYVDRTDNELRRVRLAADGELRIVADEPVMDLEGTKYVDFQADRTVVLIREPAQRTDRQILNVVVGWDRDVRAAFGS